LILTSAAAAHIPEKWAPVPACAKPLQGRTKRLDASAGEGRFRKKTCAIPKNYMAILQRFATRCDLSGSA
jgi:hypothetical protein